MGFWDRVGQRLEGWVEELAAPDAVKDALEAGQAALGAGELARAEELLRQVVAQAPEHPRGAFLLGLALLRQGRFAEARVALEAARALRPDEGEVLAALALAQRGLGEDEAALKTARQALSGRLEEGLLADLYALRGEVFLARGELDRAVRELRKAVAASDGKDARLLGLLGRALQRDGDLSLARHCLERAALAPVPDPPSLLALVEVLLALGRPDEARLAALRLTEAAPRLGEGRLALARCLLASGRGGEARDAVLALLAESPRLPAAHLVLAEVHLAVDDAAQALAHLRIARDQGEASPSLLARILALAVEEARSSLLAAEAEAHLRAEPNEALALAAAAWGASDPARAFELVARSLAAGETFAGRLVLGRLELEAGRPEAAIVALRSALRLRPASRVARRCFEEACRALVGGEVAAAEESLHPVLRRVERLLAARPALSALAAQTARLSQEVDLPLLLAVMGEFNSGKSTFVNALIGREVAPMGVTPTTATINVLKYGREPGARVVWRDDREELLSFEELGPFLRQLEPARARGVRVVEILVPAEELQRVNVVDTPGLNSLLEEHEQTAREYLAQADAVVWLFSAGQAGKQTEEEALALIGRQRLKTVGVLNKVDRLTVEEREAVLAHLRQGFGELVDDVLPVSARQALGALAHGAGEPALEESGFPALRAHLETRIFARSRALKRAVVARRLGETLGQALEQLEGERVAVAAGRELAAELDERCRTERPAARLDAELARLRVELGELHRRNAGEVVDFVRPRRSRFGEHAVSRADRDFLLELWSHGLAQLGQRSQARVAAEVESLAETLHAALRREASPAASTVLARTAELVLARAAERRALLEQQVYARFAAYARGYLAGGRVERFFAVELPELELETARVAAVLAERPLDLEGELFAPLREWDAATTQVLREVVRDAGRELSLLEQELELRLLGPLSALRAALPREAPA
ncbi:MAG: dynamin family protein [Deltaproteobacteria bacterium]|nr:dynamin family protein [Deltaproteobacteria bacterium]